MRDLPPKRSPTGFAARWKASFEREGRLPTTFLFEGPEGSGRREAAEEIARTLLGNRESPPDLIRIVPDKKTSKSEKLSIRIDPVRELIRRLSLRPLEGDRIIVLIEQVEMMTEEAANALLKTLEEPPPYVLFILISSAPERLPSTIRSRCQRVFFRLDGDRMRERFGVLFEEWGGTILPLLEGDPRPFSRASRLAEGLPRENARLLSFLEILKGVWHDLAVFGTTRDEESLLVPAAITAVRREAGRRDPARVLQEIGLIDETERAIEGNVNKTLALERLFVKLTS